MKQLYSAPLKFFGLTILLTAGLLAAPPGTVQAAPGTLAQTPLYVGPAVEPNIVFLADDSGSMEWTLMTPESNGIVSLNGYAYFYSMPAPGNNYFWVVASEEYAINNWGEPWPALGVWRSRNFQYNKIYYNPNFTYTPWKGVNNAGVPYGNAIPAAALVDPYNPGAGSVNLTKAMSYGTDFPGHSFSTINNYYPARYYIWTDSNGDGVVDPGDAHQLVEITNAPTNMTPTPPLNYPGGTNRTDCANPLQCSYAEEIQNFANWFTYYRSRALATKNAIANASADLTGVRIGYGTINNNNNVKIKVASMNQDPSTGSKKAFFDKVFQTRPSGGTPLRERLRQVGLYFECQNGNLFGASGSSCPILPAAKAGMCQKNVTILMTDGFYNGWSPSISPSNTDGDNNTAFDGPPYGDGHSRTLADVAMHFYERDLNNSLPNEVPFSPTDRDQASHQHMVTYTVAFGVTGTLDPDDTKTPGDPSDTDPTNSAFSWPDPASGDPQKIDDLWHAAYNGRGEFFSAQDTTGLINGLQSAFASAARGLSSASAVAFNTTTLDTGSLVFQAKFNPSDNWKGELIATNLAMDGTLTTTAWNSADALDSQLPSSRTIITYNDNTGNGVPFDTLANLSTRQKDDLNTGSSGSADGKGQARIDYLRGDRSNEGAGLNFRIRSSALGDIVHSNPVYVGDAQSGYQDDPSIGDGLYSNFKNSMGSRPGVTYVGANDGMLHGFRVTDGSEILAYIPNMLFSNQSGKGLHYLTDQAYSSAHRYYADLSPTVADVYLGGAWKTLLIGGYRAGGRGLFALDITDPTTFSEANASSIVQWEFSSNDDSDLGHTFSKPTIALMENGKWAAIFGNGYNDLGSGEAKLFIYYLDGSGYRKITTGAGTAGNRNGLSTPAVVDIDGNGKADRVYAGDLMGNLWAFDLSNTSDSQWDVAYKNGPNKKALFAASIGGINQPITDKPVIARHPHETTTVANEPNLLIFFGTGQFLVNGDKGNSDIQSFYGVWDDGPAPGPLPYTRSNLIAQTLDPSSTVNLRVPTNNIVDYNSQSGWYFDLPTGGERVVVNPKIRGKYVFFNTLIPDPSSCNSQGYGWLMALQLVDGSRPVTPVFDVNNDGQVDSGDATSGNSPGGVRLDGIPAGSNFLSKKMYTPDDKGNVDVRTIDAGTTTPPGRLSWREVTP